MNAEQAAALARRYRDAQLADHTMSLQLAEDALRYVVHHPGEPLPAEAAELLLAALSRLHQVERAARAVVRGDAGGSTITVDDALRANLGNGRSLDDEARR